MKQTRWSATLLLLSVGIALTVIISVFVCAQDKEKSVVHVLSFDGMLNGIMSEYLIDGIADAETEHAAAVLIEINSPGGRVDAMNDVIQAIMASTIPVIGYVPQSAGMTASAAALIFLSCDIAVMNPHSSLGAAHPILSGPIASILTNKKYQENLRIQINKATSDITNRMKVVSKQNGRNFSIIKSMIVDSLSITSEEALEQNVIDYCADTRAMLFSTLNGVSVTKNKRHYILRLQKAETHDVLMNLTELFLYYLQMPTFAYLFLILGLAGMYFELQSPGIGFAGAIGSIGIIGALYGLTALPVNFIALLAIVTAVILFYLESRMPSAGILTAAGIILLAVGSVMLFRRQIHVEGRFPELPPGLIAGVVIGYSMVAVVMGYLILKGHRMSIKTGREELIGQKALVRVALNPTGKIFIFGEYWNAVTHDNSTVAVGEWVRILDEEHLHLTVEPVKKRTLN